MTTGRINQGARVLRAETRAPIIVRGDRLGARGCSPGPAGPSTYMTATAESVYTPGAPPVSLVRELLGMISLDIFGGSLCSGFSPAFLTALIHSTVFGAAFNAASAYYRMSNSFLWHSAAICMARTREPGGFCLRCARCSLVGGLLQKKKKRSAPLRT